MNWITAITSNYDRVIRRAHGFSGNMLNIYPWPTESFVTRVSFSGSYSLPTGPLVGTNVGAKTNVFFNPVRINVLGNNNGDYNSETGVYVVNPAGIGYLRIDFGTRIGPVDVVVEGVQASSKYKTFADTSSRSVTQKFNRICTGTSGSINAFVKNATPIVFKNVSESLTDTTPLQANNGTTVFNLTGTTHTYLLSDGPFIGFQINLGTEDYTRVAAYSLQYWNGSSWASVGGTINSTTSAYNDTALVFHQSGIVTWTAPSDWTPATVSGDAYPVMLNDLGNYAVEGTNYSYSSRVYALRIVPPGTNTETVPVISIALFN